MYSASLPLLPLQVSTALEILCLLFLLHRLFLKRRALGAAFVFGSWQAFGTVIASVTLLDCIVAAFNTHGIGPRTFRLARFCRPLVYIAFTKRLRQVAARVLWSVPKVVDVLMSLAICIVAFVWVGILLFARTDEGWEKFGDWTEAFASLWILFTTANFPDVMLPALNQSRYAFLFFCAYLIISLYLLNNVLLAAMYNAYKDRWRASVKVAEQNRRVALGHAFALVAGGGETIPCETWAVFFSAYAVGTAGSRDGAGADGPRRSCQRGSAILELLGIDQSRGFHLDQFMACMEVLLDGPFYIASTRSRKVLNNRWAGFMYRLMCSGITVRGRRVLWDHIVDILIFIQLIVIFVQTAIFISPAAGGRFSDQSLETNQIFFILCFAFSCFYTAEVSLKIFLLGFERFWHGRSFQHLFDFFTVYSLILCELLYLCFGRQVVEARMIVLIRLARALRLLRHIRPLHQLWTLLTRLLPTYWQLGSLLFLVYYIFATLGQLCFGGLIYTSNKDLDGTDFQKEGYWALNFNDFASGLMTLFVLMVVNNWCIIADAFLHVTGTKWTSCFFVSYFLVVHLVALNILVALILECFAALQHDTGGSQPAAPAGGPQGTAEAEALRRSSHRSNAALLRLLLAQDHDGPLAAEVPWLTSPREQAILEAAMPSLTQRVTAAAAVDMASPEFGLTRNGG